MLSEGLDEAGRKQPRASGALLRAFVPTVVPLLMDVDDIVHLQLKLVFPVRRIGRYAAITLTHCLRARLWSAACIQRIGLAVVVNLSGCRTRCNVFAFATPAQIAE